MLLNHFDSQFETSFQAESVTPVLGILTDPPFQSSFLLLNPKILK